VTALVSLSASSRRTLLDPGGSDMQPRLMGTTVEAHAFVVSGLSTGSAGRLERMT